MKDTSAWNKKLDAFFDTAKKTYLEDHDSSAVELFKSYLRHRPKHAAALFFYGASLQNIGLRKKAEKSYLKAIELAPPDKRYQMYARLGVLHYDWGNIKEAEIWLSRACRSKEGKNIGWIWIYRGCNYFRAGKLQKAASSFLAATQMDDSDIDEAFFNLGNIYRAQGRYKEAKTAYRKALKIDPDYTLAQERLDSLKDIEKAIRKANSMKMKDKSK